MGDVTPPPAPDPRDAKAQAAAAKAYAKAQRNWFARHKILTAIGAIVIIAIIATAASGGGGDDDNKSTADHSAKKDSGDKTTKTDSGDKAKNSGSESDGKTSAYGSTKLPLQNGDWRLDSIQLKDDGLGDFGGTARITYTGEDQDGGDNVFTITVFVGKKVVATLNGGANTVMPGTSVTVQLLSQDKFVHGRYKYDFQNDL